MIQGVLRRLRLAREDGPRNRTYHGAVVEHAEASKLIAEIERSNPSDDHYDSPVKVLSDAVAHHARLKGRPGGIFSRARCSGMDPAATGATLSARRHAFIDRHDLEPDD